MSTSDSQKVRCSVKNCHYWQQNNVCGADEILITSNEMAQSLPQSINASMAMQVGESPVSSCTESCCKTFVAKDSHNAFKDGVFR